MSVLPDNYEVPSKANGYFKLQQGDNKLRIMSDVILGYEWWVREDGTIKAKNALPMKGDKPVRIQKDSPVPVLAADVVKHFWAVVVYNYTTESFQILEITQKGIQQSLLALERSKAWGDLRKYDVVINRTGEKMETVYNVVPEPPTKLSKEITDLYEKIVINLEALYDNGDPFFTNDLVGQNEDVILDLPSDPIRGS